MRFKVGVRVGVVIKVGVVVGIEVRIKGSGPLFWLVGIAIRRMWFRGFEYNSLVGHVGRREPVCRDYDTVGVIIVVVIAVAIVRNRRVKGNRILWDSWSLLESGWLSSAHSSSIIRNGSPIVGGSQRDQVAVHWDFWVIGCHISGIKPTLCGPV